MSASDGVKRDLVQKEQAVLSPLHYVRANIVSYFMLFARKPRYACVTSSCLHVGAGALGAIVVIIATMMVIDAPAVGTVAHLPLWLIAIFDWLTDFGKSGWFLAPIALALATIAVLASPALPIISRRVLAAFAVRLGFVFSAISGAILPASFRTGTTTETAGVPLAGVSLILLPF